MHKINSIWLLLLLLNVAPGIRMFLGKLYIISLYVYPILVLICLIPDTCSIGASLGASLLKCHTELNPGVFGTELQVTDQQCLPAVHISNRLLTPSQSSEV